MATIKELKTEIEKSKLGWSVHERLLDNIQIPQYRTGGLTQDLTVASEVKKLDFKQLFLIPTTNPFINERRIAHKFISNKIIKKEDLRGSSQILEAGAGEMPLGERRQQVLIGETDGDGHGSPAYGIKMVVRLVGHLLQWR